MLVSINISVGELIDKITILEIKAERILDPEKVVNVLAELESLSQVVLDDCVKASELAKLTAELKLVNERLWDIEDQIRGKEKEGDFGSEFIALARKVYKTNDRRSDIKRKINQLAGSKIIEEKSYQHY